MSDSTGGRGDRVKLFSLQEANDLVPIVSPMLEKLSEAMRSLEESRDRLALLSPSMRSNGHRAEALELERTLERSVGTVSQLVQAIGKMGIQLKDVEQGIIDFPSLQRGRVVLLCWRLGEDEIAYWHEINSGFAGRRPISDLA